MFMGYVFKKVHKPPTENTFLNILTKIPMLVISLEWSNEEEIKKKKTSDKIYKDLKVTAHKGSSLTVQIRRTLRHLKGLKKDEF